MAPQRVPDRVGERRLRQRHAVSGERAFAWLGMSSPIRAHSGSPCRYKHATNRLARLRLPQPQTLPPAYAGAIYTAADRHEISFRLTGHRGEVACAITRKAPEVPFWLPPDAEQIRLLKAFADGR